MRACHSVGRSFGRALKPLRAFTSLPLSACSPAGSSIGARPLTRWACRPPASARPLARAVSLRLSARASKRHSAPLPIAPSVALSAGFGFGSAGRLRASAWLKSPARVAPPLHRLASPHAVPPLAALFRFRSSAGGLSLVRGFAPRRSGGRVPRPPAVKGAFVTLNIRTCVYQVLFYHPPPAYQGGGAGSVLTEGNADTNRGFLQMG